MTRRAAHSRAARMLRAALVLLFIGWGALACDAERSAHSGATAPQLSQGSPQKPAPGSPQPAPGSPQKPVATSAAATTNASHPQALVRYTAGAQPDQTLPMLVVFHGLGDRPDNFVSVYEALPYPVRLIAARAFAPYHNGFSWFPVQISPKRASARSRDVKAAADRLAKWLEELPKQHPTAGKPLVSGFSQGGMLTFALAVYHPDKISAALPIGGALDVGELPKQAPPDAPPLWAFHGERDPLVRFTPTATLIQTMKDRGYRAELHAYPNLAHSISPALRADLFSELRGALPTP